MRNPKTIIFGLNEAENHQQEQFSDDHLQELPRKINLEKVHKYTLNYIIISIILNINIIDNVVYLHKTT